jgi:hypothetical protein
MRHTHTHDDTIFWQVDLTNTRMGSGAALLVADGIISNDVLEVGSF